MKLPLNNLNYPVRILIGGSSGSGFLISHKNKVYLVTAKHVIYRQDQTTKEFILFNEKLTITCHTILNDKIQNPPKKYEANLTTLLSNKDLKSHPDSDIVVIKLGNLNGNFALEWVPGISVVQDAEGALVHYAMQNSRKFGEVEITNDVFVLGYPVSLSSEKMKQINYDIPLVRKGIVAGKNYENKTIILDCPVYGGNSGGMALEINSDNSIIHLIGVVVQFVPFVEQWQNTKFPELFNTHYQNSGYSIVLPTDFIYDLIDEIEEV